MDFDTKSSNIFLLEFARKMTFNECRLARATVTNKDELEGRHTSRSWWLYRNSRNNRSWGSCGSRGWHRCSKRVRRHLSNVCRQRCRGEAMQHSGRKFAAI